MKRISVIIATILLLALATPALAYTMYAIFSVANDTGADIQLADGVDIDNQYLLDEDYMSTDNALDARVQTASLTDLPTMIVEDKTMFSVELNDGETKNLRYTLGNSARSTMEIIPGYGGDIIVYDDPSMEGGNNWKYEINGYVDLLTSSYIASKAYAFYLQRQSGTSIRASIYGDFANPTGTTDSGGVWSDDANAIDGSDADYAWVTAQILPSTWSNYLEGTFPSANVSGFRYYCDVPGETTEQIDIDYYNGGWVDVYQGTFNDLAWVSTYLSGGFVEDVTKIRIRLYNPSGAASRHGRIYAMQYVPVIRNIATGIAPDGDYMKIEAYADATNWVLEVDDVVKASTPLNGLSMVDNDSNWFVMRPAIIYADNITLSVAGTPVMYFAPNDMIELDPGGVNGIMPDRSGNGNTGNITFGSTPAGVTTGALAPFISVSQPVPAVAEYISGEEKDILPPTGQHGTTISPVLSFIQPVVDILASETGFSSNQLWIGAGTFALLIFMAIAWGVEWKVASRGGIDVMITGSRHMGAMGIAGLVGAYVLWHLGIYPWWSMILMAGVAIWSLISERTPSW